MQEILIKTTIADLRFQYATIGRLEREAEAKGHFKRIAGIAIATAAYLALMFTAADSFIMLKAIVSILLLMAWIYSMLFYIWYFIKKFRKKVLINRLIHETLHAAKEQFLTYDSNEIAITTNHTKSAFSWEHFMAYYDTECSIFLFPEGPIYSAMAFTESEIGKQHVESLKAIAKSKLAKLDTKSA